MTETVFIVHGTNGAVAWIVRGFLNRSDAEDLMSRCNAHAATMPTATEEIAAWIDASPDPRAPEPRANGGPYAYEIREELVEVE